MFVLVKKIDIGFQVMTSEPFLIKKQALYFQEDFKSINPRT